MYVISGYFFFCITHSRLCFVEMFKFYVFQLGMNEMFTDNSKLNGILEEGEPLRISDTIHKAFIEVNEGGSESGAATGKQLFGFHMEI